MTAACLVLSSLSVFAQHGTPLFFNQSDGSSVRVLFSDLDSARFEQDNNVGTFFMNDGTSYVSYSLKSCLDSISFTTPKGRIVEFPNPDDISVAFDASDESSYRNVAETVISDDSNPDYDDFVENFEYNNTITITYSGGTAVANPSGVKDVTIRIDGAHVNVTAAKKIRYVLKGETANGSFKITSDKKFILELSGVNITNPNGSAINIQSGKPTYLVLGRGTSNALTDGSQYAIVGDEDQKGTIFSEGELLISGSGSLSVTSKSAHGICSDDYIRLRDNLGSLTVNAAVDGISSKLRLVIYGGQVNVTAGDDGVVVRRGYMELMGGSLTVKATDNGMDATYSQNDTTYFKMGGGLLKVETTGDKGHGIACSGNMTFTGGILQVKVAGDASKSVNCDGDISLKDTKLTLLTGGAPLYNEEEADYSSAAGIRCRGSFSATNSIIGIRCTGRGAKGFNCDAGFSIDGCDITAVSSGGTFTYGGGTILSKALECAGLEIKNDSRLMLSASCAAMHVKGDYLQKGGTVYSFSSGQSSPATDIRGTRTISGGLLYQSVVN